MKKNIALLFGLMFICQNIAAQHADYKVVFDMSSRDTISHQAVVREVKLIKEANPDAKLEVVVYGQGLNLILKDKPQAEAVQKLLGIKDVSFKVCAITLQRTNTDKSQLVTGVEVVPDGIYEIITKQKEGWGYIKVAH
ncbi:MAG: DsrE family protein [Bacteroidota bacterium]